MNKIVALFIITIISSGANGQNSNFYKNEKYLDSTEESLRIHFCNKTITYPMDYRSKNIKNDLEIINTLNTIYSQTFYDSLQYEKLKRSKIIRFNKEDIKNGLINVINIVVNGEYIRVEITLEMIDNSIYRTLISINSNSFGGCGYYKSRVFDFNLLRLYFLKRILFPLEFRNKRVVYEMLNISNLQASSRRNEKYKFGLEHINSDDWIGRICKSQFNNDSLVFYSYDSESKDFIKLIKEERVDILKDLLYSPNYNYSVHALEAIIYLTQVGKMKIDDEMKDRIKLIKEDNNTIFIRKTDDLFSAVDGYNQLNVTDQEVVKKIKALLNK